MAAKKLSDVIWNGIVSRIIAGKSTAKNEGKAYGLPAATVRGRVLQARLLMKKLNATANADPTPTATQADPTLSNAVQRPSENALATPVPNADAPTHTTPAPTSAPPAGALEKARQEAGIPASGATPTTSASSPTSLAQATQQAESDDKKLVVSTYAGAKKAAVEILARRVGIQPAHPLMQAAAEVQPFTVTVLEANAGLIAPVIRNKVVGWPAIAGALVFDGVVTIMAVREVAIALGKQKPAAGAPSSATAAPAAAHPEAA